MAGSPNLSSSSDGSHQERAGAVLLTGGRLHEPYSKVAHGLIRDSERFEIVAVVDDISAGRDAGEVLDGGAREIPVVASFGDVATLVAAGSTKPTWAIIGVATHGGKLSPALIESAAEALRNDMSVAAGVHEYLSDVPELVELAKARGLELLDLRKPKPPSELHFWTGAIDAVEAPRLAVLGTDCAVGKRTTTRLLHHALRAADTRSELIATGQTGWLQGASYGFVLDSVPNDFVSGELEHAIVTCWEAERPDLILLEGQSALRNPSGPCGAELLLSGDARATVLQHAPGRTWFDGCESIDKRIPPVDDEIALIRHYGSEVLGVCLSGEKLTPDQLIEERDALRATLDIPVVAPMIDGVESLVQPIQAYIESATS